MDAYGRALEKLCKQVLELLAENLGLPASFINDAMDHQPWLSVRSIHYLRSNGHRAEQVALPAHTDYGALTVITQERVTHRAVQVWKDEEWMSLEQCIPGALFINIDDQIQVS
jgi:isopenicillin N synthase-like dioxygenase